MRPNLYPPDISLESEGARTNPIKLWAVHAAKDLVPVPSSSVQAESDTTGKFCKNMRERANERALKKERAGTFASERCVRRPPARPLPPKSRLVFGDVALVVSRSIERDSVGENTCKCSRRRFHASPSSEQFNISKQAAQRGEGDAQRGGRRVRPYGGRRASRTQTVGTYETGFDAFMTNKTPASVH